MIIPTTTISLRDFAWYLTEGYQRHRGQSAFLRKPFSPSATLGLATRLPINAAHDDIVLGNITIPERSILRYAGSTPAAGSLLVPGSVTVVPRKIGLRAVAPLAPTVLPESATAYAETQKALILGQFAEDLADVAWTGNTTAPAATTLSGSLNATAKTLSCATTAGYPDTGIVVIQSERIRYAGKTSGSFTGLTRGYDGTTATTHSTGSALGLAADFCLLSVDGWATLLAAGTHVVDGSYTSGGSCDRSQFKAMIASMPSRHLTPESRKSLRWLMSPATALAFLESQATLYPTPADRLLWGADGHSPYGIPIVEDSAIPGGTIVLTNPANLLFALTERFTVTATDTTSRAYSADLYIGVGVADMDAVVYNTGITI